MAKQINLHHHLVLITTINLVICLYLIQASSTQGYTKYWWRSPSSSSSPSSSPSPPPSGSTRNPLKTRDPSNTVNRPFRPVSNRFRPIKARSTTVTTPVPTSTAINTLSPTTIISSTPPPSTELDQDALDSSESNQHKSSQPPENRPSAQPSALSTPSLPASTSPPKFPEISDQLSADMVNIIRSNNDFGFKLMKSLIKFHGKNNLLISPLSLFSTLVTVYAGSSTSTENEMIHLLQLKEMSESQVETAFRDVLHTLLYDAGRQNSLKMLNAILVDKDLNVSSAFVDKIRTYYNAYLEKVGFTTEPAYVLSWTNELVNWWTQGLIPALLENPLDPLTKLLLINVIYFKGKWSETFNPINTYQHNFRNHDGTVTRVAMMKQIASFNYHCESIRYRACAVEQFYAGDSLSFLTIIPTNGTDLTNLERHLSSGFVNEMIAGLGEASLELSMPRFSASGSYDLLKPLEDLGMKAAFSPESADLSRMGNSKELFVKEAKHKTVIQVSEEGTVAAAATVAEIGTRKRSHRFTIDRPFLFLIRDLRTDAILFLGRINSLP